MFGGAFLTCPLSAPTVIELVGVVLHRALSAVLCLDSLSHEQQLLLCLLRSSSPVLYMS